MDRFEARVGGVVVQPVELIGMEWIDRAHGVARLSTAVGQVEVLIEGRNSDWVVTLAGRRIPVSVQSWRERMLADAESAAGSHAGPVEITATLPGLVVAVEVAPGS